MKKATAYRKVPKKQATAYRAIRVKVASAYQVINEALERAVVRGINRCNKYARDQFEPEQRDLLLREVVESFWIALEDAGLEVK